MEQEKNPYDDIPHQGKPFKEGDDSFYWNFSNVAIGTTVREWRWGMTIGAQIDSASGHATKHHGLAHVMAVESRQTPDGTITKWKCCEGHGTERDEPGVLNCGTFTPHVKIDLS